ncbi:hypothetical protein HY449_02750 [Candidatus Pacearchaeota archaeon]|nr:hypothetical protein [Candidatus Pacearchaeota archaeon]
MEKCEMYESLKPDYTENSKKLFCPMEVCPYNNGIPLGWEAEGHLTCKTYGIVEKKGLIPSEQKKGIETITQQNQL